MTNTHANKAIPQDEKISAELAEFLWEEVNSDIGASLKKARDTRRMLQAEVAKVMGVQASRVSQIESTKGISMTLDVLARYVAALGYRLDVDIVDPETDAIVAVLPIVPLSFMPIAEVEARAQVEDDNLTVTTSVSKPLPRRRPAPSSQPWRGRPGDWIAREEKGDNEYLAAA